MLSTPLRAVLILQELQVQGWPPQISSQIAFLNSTRLQFGRRHPFWAFQHSVSVWIFPLELSSLKQQVLHPCQWAYSELNQMEVRSTPFLKITRYHYVKRPTRSGVGVGRSFATSQAHSIVWRVQMCSALSERKGSQVVLQSYALWWILGNRFQPHRFQRRLSLAFASSPIYVVHSNMILIPGRSVDQSYRDAREASPQRCDCSDSSCHLGRSRERVGTWGWLWQKSIVPCRTTREIPWRRRLTLKSGLDWMTWQRYRLQSSQGQLSRRFQLSTLLGLNLTFACMPCTLQLSCRTVSDWVIADREIA